jgi:hypothetical protein
MSDVSNRVLARFRKLMNLANNAGATEGERAAALHHANTLMQKYNLSLAELPPEQNDEAREEQKVTISGDRWIRDICGDIADLFFCKYLYSSTGTSGKTNHHFIGRQSNVITAMGMSEYLIKSIKREATKRYRTPTTPEGRSFCVGATRTLCVRIGEEKAAKVAQADKFTTARAETEYGMDEVAKETSADFAGVKTTALALANLYKSEEEANALVVANLYGDRVQTKKYRQGGNLQANAFYDGKEHGKTIGLNQQVGGTVPKRTAIGN